MYALYSFNFLDTISKQLRESLDGLDVTVMDTQALGELGAFQNHHGLRQGVYVVHYEGSPKYVGKAVNLADRLSQHYRKLMGRRNIEPSSIGYKCLILDGSMSTAANEKLLIAQYSKDFPEMWNGRGFGPNDPGKQRDTTAPNYFDGHYPIRLDIRLEGIGDSLPLGELAERMKRELPYVFRYSLEGRADEIIDLENVERTPDRLLQALVDHLGEGWRGAILSYGLVFYKNLKSYPFGSPVNPSPR